MRPSTSHVALALLLVAVAGHARAQNGSIGVYADVTATQTSTTFSIGVPRSIFIVARLAGESEFGTTGAEFFVAGFPQDWLVFVTPNSAAGVVLGNPFVETGGVRRANLAFPACMNEGTGRVLLYSAVVVATSSVAPGNLDVVAGDPPTNPSIPFPILTKCDPPNYTLLPVQGGSFQFEVRAPQDLDYSSLPGFDGERGVQPMQGMPGDIFHFRASYSNSALTPPAAGMPRVELDANGDGDVLDPGEGAFTMSPADLDSTLANGKEYRYDVALGEPPGGMYRYRFTAVDALGAPVAGAATAWRESLFVNRDQMDLAVRAAHIRVLPPQPLVNQITAIVARIENRSNRRAENVLVRIEDAFGAVLKENTLAAIGPRSTTEVVIDATFAIFNFQPVVVRVDPGNTISECDETNNVAAHGVFVGGVGVGGRLWISGMPPQISIPPAAPFLLAGDVHYVLNALNVPASSAEIVVRPSWESASTLYADAAGEFLASIVSPATSGFFSLTFVASDGARTDSVAVNMNVFPTGGGQPPHGPNLSMQLAAQLGLGCPAATANMTWSVANRGDRASTPSTVRLLLDGATHVTEVMLGAIAPGAAVNLPLAPVSLPSPGPHALTAHVDPAGAQRELREDDNAAHATVRVQTTCLDLALDQVRTTSMRFCNDEAVGFAARVVNRGCEASNATRVSCRVGATEIASAPLAALAPGATTEVAFSHQFQVACHDLEFVLDPDGIAGNDCDLESNATTASACVAQCGPPPPPQEPDFRVLACDLRASDPSPAAGDLIRFEAWISNVGTGYAYLPVFVQFQVDGMDLGPTVSVGPMAPGARLLAVSPSAWPVDFDPHLLTVTLDPNGQPDATPLDHAAERPMPHELRLLAIPPCDMFSPCQSCSGGQIYIQAYIVNDGIFDCDPVRVEFRDALQGNAVIGSATTAVAAGNECPCCATLVLIGPSFSMPGLHAITAIVDPDQRWVEVDEGNNTHTQGLNIGCAMVPDLVAQARLPEGFEPQPGDTIRAVEVRVTNQGSGAATGVGARLRLDGATLCDLAMGSVAAGTTVMQICTTPWILDDASCSQRLEACADPSGTVGESNEFNNCSTTGVGSTAETDLAVFQTSIQITPTDPHAFQQVVIEVSMYNFGLVESTCRLIAEYSLGSGWVPIGEVPLRLPAGQFFIEDAATFVWVTPQAELDLRFRIEDVCPFDVFLGNNVVLATLPWFVPPPTPVAVSDFTATSQDQGVTLRWRAEPIVAAFAFARRGAGETAWERLSDSLPVEAGSGIRSFEWFDASAPAGALEYMLLGRLPNGAEETLGVLSVQHTRGVGRFAELLPVRPHPFRPGGAIEFTVPSSREVDLSIYDSAGRLVVQLWRGEQVGRRSVVWDARNGHGQRVPAGVYFCRLTAASSQQTRRIVLLR